MMYWAVPVFFMITGMLFLRKEMHVKSSEWLFKYSRRILLALVVFGIPYAALKLVMADGLSISLLDKAILAFLSDTGFGHLWYLYALIGIYLIMPVLKKFVDNASEGEIQLVLCALFVLDFCFPLFSRLSNLKIAFNSQFLYPVFYFLLFVSLHICRRIFDRCDLFQIFGRNLYSEFFLKRHHQFKKIK